ncbi:MAG: polyprenyl synthetase family protein, partial [Parasporobacterium sp.]|nr:polyprenyl synthetase family protein [Parasporobacterium sp.]
MRTIPKSLIDKTKEAQEAVGRFLLPEDGLQNTLSEACNYSVTAGGKRLRPVIMKAVYEAFGGKGDAIEPFMAAMEMIHSFSLVHDDLPCMDNDEYRRGKLTTWKKYGYAMGVLAGDGLLAEAFKTAACAAEYGASPERVLKAIEILARKSGVSGMIGGQSLDVEKTGQKLNPEELDFIFRLKTAALLEASMMIGCVMAGGDDASVKECEAIASLIGQAFQIRDDILDETATSEQLGKPAGSDRRNEKTTYVTLHG